MTNFLHLAFGRVALAAPIRCPRCRWAKSTVSRQQADLMGIGYTVACPLCAIPMTGGRR